MRMCQINVMQNISSQMTIFLTIVALVSGFVYPSLSAYTAVYVAIGAMFAGFVLHGHVSAKMIATPPYMLVFGSFALYMIFEPFRWNGIDNLIILAVFVPVAASVGLAALLHVEPRLNSSFLLGCLCLAGSLGAFFVAVNDIFILNLPRAGGGNNPIHFADLTVTIGFLSIIGIFGIRSPWRFIFFVGPILASASAMLSGTRGVVMTIIVLSVILTLTFSIWQRSIRPVLVVSAVLLVIIVSAIAVKPQVIARAQDGWQQSIVTAHHLLFDKDTGEKPDGVDNSTDYRISMMRSAWSAFLDSPIFGHGAGQIIPATRPYYPERNSGIGAHLHSDIADFMVAGGIVGLLSYLALLAAPFATIWMAQNTAQQRMLFVGAVVLSGTYFCNGLTNAVFGLLPQSTLFGMALASLVVLAQNNTNSIELT